MKTKKWKKKFLAAVIFCLVIVGGGGIIYFVKKEDKVAKISNNYPTSLDKNPVSNSEKYSKIKIKKVPDNNLYLLKSESQYKNGGSNSEVSLSKENFSKVIQDFIVDENKGSRWKRIILENCWEELKDNLWLVKEKRKEQGKNYYYAWYENNHGEKIGEVKKEG